MREQLSEDLLGWYDQHARVMPWRVGPAARATGERPDPYGIWMSEVMLQQTTVAAVRDYWRKFMAKWPTVSDLAAAEDADVMAAWAGLGYYARARNLLKCARVVAADHGGVFPDTVEALLKLPGVGPYTAAAVASIAFDAPATVVDGNVERVIARLRLIETPLPKAKPEVTEAAEAITPQDRPGDYAQAIMDLGATICTPRNPACGICPWSTPCLARAQGVQAELPKKLPKKTKPTRHGYIYLARRGDHWLVEQRPDKGLLGGMIGFPGSDWSDDPVPAAPFVADWREVGEVRHTFTHFHLVLRVHTVEQSSGGVEFQPVVRDDLPTVFRKALDLVSAYE